MGIKKILFNDGDVAKFLNNFFSNVIKLLGISQNHCQVFMGGIRDPTLKAISKYGCHPSVLEFEKNILAISTLPFRKLWANPQRDK